MPKMSAMEIMAAAAEAQMEANLVRTLESFGRFISVFDLHISDVILEETRGKDREQIIAELHRNPRGCKGKTHVRIQNGPTMCYDNCASVKVKRSHNSTESGI